MIRKNYVKRQMKIFLKTTEKQNLKKQKERFSATNSILNLAKRSLMISKLEIISNI